MKKYATKEGTLRYREKLGDRVSHDHFRKIQDLWISSIGFGSYLGNHDDATDISYQNALTHAIGLGCNHIDTAINYRFQRSERAIGSALETVFNEGNFNRDELIVATKGGYIPFDSEPPSDMRKYFDENFLEPGIATLDDMVSGMHCMTTKYIDNQLETSLENLGLESIDIYYLHNPEEQLRELSREEFNKCIASVFELLEKKVSDGKIRMYGTATWNGYRQEAKYDSSLSLPELVDLAEKIAGKEHHFKVIQLPFNLAMPEPLILRNQSLDGEMLTVIESARRLGVTVIASSSLLQRQLTEKLPDFIVKHLRDLDTDAQRAIQFVRSTPGITSALVGMSRMNHVEENMWVAKLPPASIDDINNLFS
ncbi:MAG TPA: aldo/keto reductase [Thermodesulfobacteriota bacterium]|jgi:aryl-alcohol dehydrogenase-like predicted oxidoreductase